MLKKIIFLILGFALVSFFIVGYLYNKSKPTQEIPTNKSSMRMLIPSLDLFKLDCGRFPTSKEGLEILLKKPPTLDCPKYDTAGYVSDENLLKDMYGNQWLYISNGLSYEVISYGSDGKSGGEGDAIDISSKDL